LTTVIAIKCKDGIVIASDSQGTSNTIKLKSKKIYGISKFIGLGGAGDSSQIKYVVNQLGKDLKSQENKEFELEESLQGLIVKTFANLHKCKNVDNCSNSGYYSESFLPFCPDILVIAKVKNQSGETYYLYRGGFGEIGRYKVKTSDVFLVNNDFETIGSGSHLAYLVLNQQTRMYSLTNKKLSDLPLSICIGMALYVISEVKDIDSLSGKDTQIAVIDRDGFREISPNEQPNYYEIMVENLSSSIRDLLNNGKMNEVVKMMLSVSQTTIL
jgi:20S proteasome alpha/beta subunit